MDSFSLDITVCSQGNMALQSHPYQRDTHFSLTLRSVQIPLELLKVAMLTTTAQFGI
jgi:hypothetical protein